MTTLGRMLVRFLVSVFALAALVSADLFRLDADDHIVAPAGDDVARASRDSLLWGPYRSGKYFGVRPRIPRSLISGLFWFNVDTHLGLQNIRHSFEQNHDLGRASWTEFDPRIGGSQTVSDNHCHIDVIIDYVKSANGKNWGAKVRAIPHKGYEHVKTSFVWYSGLEGEKADGDSAAMLPTGFLKLDQPFSSAGYDGIVGLSGMSEELGFFEIKINDGDGDNVHPLRGLLPIAELNPEVAHHLSLRVPDGNIWRAAQIFVTLLQESVKDLVESNGEEMQKMPTYQGLLLRDLHRFEGNMHFVQRTYEGKCEFDITYNEGTSPQDQKVTFENIDTRIKDVRAKLANKFNAVFQLPQSDLEFGQELLSGLLGGLSYFHGDHLVDRETSFEGEDMPVNINGDVHLPKLEGKREGPHELFTLVPSRAFFPRGFYWDEGFHFLPLIEYDPDLVLEIFESWVNLIDETGWLAREQILGDEARSRVPEEFVVQSSSVVNPPTLMLAFTQLLERVAGQSLQKNLDLEEDIGLALVKNDTYMVDYVKRVYPKLKLHYESFRASQQGEVEDFDRGSNREMYRWRGRTLTHSLACGLDDYPRVLPIDIAELNVDLLSWVGVMTKSIKALAEILQLEEDVAAYTEIEEKITDNLDKIHWSDEHKAYCDVSVDEDDQDVFACFKGYISLFPFLTRFLPPTDTEKLGHIIDLIADPEELWSDFGLRSLSKSDPLYRTAENYWRSPIWMNINYLALDAVSYYYDVSKEHMSEELREKMKQVYTDLRANLISTVKLLWEKTGFVWEQYDDETGEGKGGKSFMGWTSLVLLMMNMPATLGP